MNKLSFELETIAINESTSFLDKESPATFVCAQANFEFVLAKLQEVCKVVSDIQVMILATCRKIDEMKTAQLQFDLRLEALEYNVSQPSFEMGIKQGYEAAKKVLIEALEQNK